MQWFYFDSLECLPEDEEAWPNENTAAPTGSRYDGQTAVFGAEFQKKLEKLKYFVVKKIMSKCQTFLLSSDRPLP